MGIFPIMMNILQFWLIDSIVKSSPAASVALPTLTPRSSADGEHEHEPLFHASSDDEDDDGAFPAHHDIENPRPRSRSHSIDSDRLVPDEPKSLGSGTSTAVGSSPGTPKGSKPIDIKREAEPHAYPPSLAGSSVLTASSSVASSSRLARSRSPKRKRSDPPPPALPLQPLSPPVRRHTHNDSLTPKPERRQSHHEEEKEWGDWGEEGDDWAERVGEEEWTGRRMEARKEEVDSVWAQHHRTTSSVS